MYNLCIVHREQESLVFNELVNSIAYTLEKIGHTVNISVNAVLPGEINVVFGTHISPLSIVEDLPPNTIIYNTEQFQSIWLTEEYINLLKRFRVWDYSLHNTNMLKTMLGVNAEYVPVGFCPLLERIVHKPEQEKDIDVLLYGSVNERRRRVMEKLHANGLKTLFVYDAFGETRDKLIARSKIVLNVHYYDSAILETVRLSYLLNNKCFVVTETSKDWKDCDAYHYTMVMSEYRWIVEDCMEYIHAAERRQNVANCGYMLFKEYQQQEKILNEITRTRV